MFKKFPIPDLAAPPPTGFSFLVIFYGIGKLPLPNAIDIRFQKVSGIGASFDVDQQEVQRGSMNDMHSTLPGKRNYPPLILERGMVVGVSPLALELKSFIENRKVKKHDLHVILMDSNNLPIGNWFFKCAYPVSWSISDLDANSNNVMIERLEMRYHHLKSIGI